MKRVAYLTLLIGILVYGLTALLKRRDDTTRPQSFGSEFNYKRAEDKVPIIEATWIVQKHDTAAIRYGSPLQVGSTDDPVHVWKTIHLVDGKLAFEEDIFNNEVADTLIYRLLIQHDFDKRFVRTRNQLITVNLDGRLPIPTRAISDSAADSILAAWGLR
jgi:hypothetical protein